MQQYGNTAPGGTASQIQRSDGQYCFPVSCVGFNGTTTIIHSQANSISGKGAYPYKNFPYTGSGSSSNFSNVDMGAIHLVTDASAAGGGTAATFDQGYWSDTLTIGNNFASGTTLQFLVGLNLTGSVSASSGLLKQHNDSESYGSSAWATAVSKFSISDNYWSAITSNQEICIDSKFGKTGSCGGGDAMAPSSESYVFSTFPGATVTVTDNLSLSANGYGDFLQYGCGNAICTKYASGSASSYFLNTSLFTLTPLTPGAFYTSASGTVYSGSSGPLSATPEPPSAFLVLSGLLGLLALCRNGASLARRRVGPQIP